MPTPEDAKAKAAAAYNAAAHFYDDPTNTFWDRFGHGTIERIGLRPGERVLDACCGAGASAIPAAERVGPQGSVLGVDLAHELLALARAKAKARGLENIEFRVGDMLDPEVSGSQYDAVVCVFGIFFVPDMADAVRSLWSAVRPGGRLAITTWGPDLFEPASTAFWHAVREERPDLYKGFNPWDRICEPEPLRELLREAGIDSANVVAEAGTQPIPSSEAWWSVVLGSGYRGTIEELDVQGREHVRLANMRFIRESGTTSIETNVVYAVAEKEEQEER